MIHDLSNLLLDTRCRLSARRNLEPDTVFPSVTKLTHFEAKEVDRFNAEIDDSLLVTVQRETHLLQSLLREVNQQSRMITRDDEHVITVAYQLPIRARFLQKPSYSPVAIKHMQIYVR